MTLPIITKLDFTHMKMNPRKPIHTSTSWPKLKESTCSDNKLMRPDWVLKLRSWVIQRKDQISLETEKKLKKTYF